MELGLLIMRFKLMSSLLTGDGTENAFDLRIRPDRSECLPPDASLPFLPKKKTCSFGRNKTSNENVVAHVTVVAVK